MAQECLVDDLGQKLLDRFCRVLAITVGGLHKQHIRRTDQLRCPHDRVLRPAQVTREDQGLALRTDLHSRRAQDMASRAQQQVHALGNRRCLMQLHRAQ
ncbi:hypothetical protein D3C81_994340 [compost metagenome]